MRIELHSSNRNEWPLGTGRSPMHGRALTDMRCRTTHGPKGTAQGNRGSAAQGGIRASLESLPFKTTAFTASALMLAGAGTAAVASVASAISITPLFRESCMSLAHFVLGCVVVALALLAYSLVATVSSGIALMQPRTH